MTESPLKSAIEIALIGESHLAGNLRNRQAGFFQETDRTRKANMEQVTDEAHPGHSLEEPDELRDTHLG